MEKTVEATNFSQQVPRQTPTEWDRIKEDSIRHCIMDLQDLDMSLSCIFTTFDQIQEHSSNGTRNLIRLHSERLSMIVYDLGRILDGKYEVRDAAPEAIVLPVWEKAALQDGGAA